MFFSSYWSGQLSNHWILVRFQLRPSTDNCVYLLAYQLFNETIFKEYTFTKPRSCWLLLITLNKADILGEFLLAYRIHANLAHTTERKSTTSQLKRSLTHDHWASLHIKMHMSMQIWNSVNHRTFIIYHYCSLFTIIHCCIDWESFVYTMNLIVVEILGNWEK